MHRPPTANLSLVFSLAALAGLGCQQERTDVGGSASGQAASAQSAGSGGDGDGSGGGGGAPGTGGGAAGTGGEGGGSGGSTALAEACAAYCSAAEPLPCYPEDCEVLCAQGTAGCEPEFAAYYSCLGLDPDNLSCSGDQVQVSTDICPDEREAANACP